MTVEELKKIIVLALPTSTSNASDIAGSLLNMAITRVGRMKNIPFNKQVCSFSLTSGQKTYRIGSDILSGVSTQNLSELWRTDVQNWEVAVVSEDIFNDVARGSSQSGAPTHATIYDDGKGYVLEVWPSPDSAYPMTVTARVGVVKLEDIPAQYHDTLYPIAISLVNAAKDPRIALELAREGLKDIQDATMIGWAGTVIPADRNLGDVKRSTRADSGNLRPS